MRSFRCSCWLAVIFLIGLPARAEAEALADEFQIREGAGERTHMVARNELGVRDRRGYWRVEKLADAASAEGVLAAARGRRASRRSRADLVLYEKGARRDESTRRWLTGRVVLSLEPGTDLGALVRRFGAGPVEKPWFAPGVVIISAPDDPGASLILAARLRGVPGVRSADPLLARQHLRRFEPNDPFFSDHPAQPGYQWHLRNVGTRGGMAGIDANITPAWTQGRGSGVMLGIVDDGLQLAHPDLAANAAFAESFDFNEDDADPAPGEGDFHGTACAGVAAGRANNGIGICGAAPESRVAGLRLIAGPSSDMQDAEAFLHRSDAIHIKSNSWGPSDSGATIAGPGLVSSAALRHAALFAREGKGTIFLWAAGNGNSTSDNSNFDGWANSIYAIGVSAVGDNGRRASYSEPGANILVCAPSNGSAQGVTTVDLVGSAGYNSGATASNYAGGDYTNNFGGTSSACPLVAGVAALMIEANPSLRWRDVQEVLVRSAVKNDADDADWLVNGAGFHFNHKYGAGLVNAAAAVALSRIWTLLPPMERRLFDAGGLPVDIPDNDAAGTAVNFEISADEDLRVEHASLEVDITHAVRGQMEISLISPSGTVSQLATGRPDSNGGLQWTFTSTHHWGEAAAGSWSARFFDRVAGASGRINALRLILDGTVPNPSLAPVITSPLAVSVAADSPFAYQIEVRGGAVAFAAEGLPQGLACDTATGQITGRATTAGQYAIELAAINAVGTDQATLLLEVTASAAAALARALDAPSLAITADLLRSWSTDGWSFHVGAEAARSPALDNLSASAMASTITGPAALSFWWKISSEPNFDYLRVFVDGIERAKIAGEVDWTQVTLGIPAGGHEVKWEYRKDDFAAAGADAAWVDGVEIRTAAQSEPVLVSAPAPFAAVEGARAIFRVEAVGQEPLSYLWRKDGQPLGGAGASSASLLLAPVRPQDAGDYAVTISNLLGERTTAPVALHVGTASISAVLGAAIEAPDLPWGSRALVAQPWHVENAVTFDGIDAARSGSASDGAITSLHTLLEGPGLLRFHWKVSSTLNYDWLQFRLDTGPIRQISGTSFWQPIVTAVGEGWHSLAWTYQKDIEQAQGNDAGYLDALTFEPTRFSSWRSLKFSAAQLEANGTGPQDDADGDGLDNFLEYALDRRPLEADAGAAAVLLPRAGRAADNGGLTFPTVSFGRRVDAAARGLDYQLLIASSLEPGAWSLLPLEVVVIDGVPGNPSLELVTVRLPLPPWTTRQFIRMVVTEN